MEPGIPFAGVEAQYVKDEILPEFFRNFWVRRMALDRRNYKQVVETTVELANKCGASEVITRIVDDLKDESEPYRRMVMETAEKIVQNRFKPDRIVYGRTDIINPRRDIRIRTNSRGAGPLFR